MNELTALCEKYQKGIADATTDLQKKTRHTNQLNMEYEEVDQSMAALKQNLNENKMRGQIDFITGHFERTFNRETVEKENLDFNEEEEYDENGEPIPTGGGFFGKPLLPE